MAAVLPTTARALNMAIRHLSRTGAAALAAAALAVSATAATAAAPTVKSLSGAGSTLVAPLVAEWAQEFPVFYGATIDYASVGSQVGLNRIASGSVDFAATDSPLTTAQRQACPDCRQIPWTLTAIGDRLHVHGAGNRLRLTPSVLAKIYLGKITKWNDSRITSLNPGVKLPALKITPISTNASGDTAVFTQYLSKVSSAWRTQVGTGDTVNFPAGLTSHGNAGMTSGHASRWPRRRRCCIVDSPKSAPAAYPVATFSYAVVSSSASIARKAALRDWIAFAVGGGQRFGQGLDFAPVPAVVASADRRAVRAFAGS